MVINPQSLLVPGVVYVAQQKAGTPQAGYVLIWTLAKAKTTEDSLLER